MLIEKRSITPEKVIALLEKERVKISPEDAALVVDFLYALALLFYQQHAADL
jgi:hypothetical protein